MSRFITHISHQGDDYVPVIILSDNERMMPLGSNISVSFDTTVRFCIGWHDMSTGKDSGCPENAKILAKHTMCVACQKRTGFNPAFYNTDNVSPQQELRNSQPHSLYLAYMGEGYIKVGITWEARGIKRLLEQGARAGLILDTFPTALIARHYEAQIAKLHGIHETTTTRTKLELLARPFSAEKARHDLLETKRRLESEMSVEMQGGEVFLLDRFYTDGQISAKEITPLPTPHISGTVESLVGDILLTQYEGRRLALPLKQYLGYPMTLDSEIDTLDLEPQQMLLF